MRLVTGTPKHKNKVDKRAEAHMKKCERTLKREKEKFNQSVKWKRIPKDDVKK